jgi:uncharacterized repeat protein (TIGR01451 family)
VSEEKRMFTHVRAEALGLILLAGTAGVLGQQRRAQPEAQPGQGMVRTELAYPTGDRATSVLLIERFTPSEVRAGVDLEYQIKVTNLTRIELQDLVLTERFPPNFTVLGSYPKTSLSPERQATWRWPRMNPGATELIRVQGTTTAPEELTFCATVGFTTGLCAKTRIVQPKLVLTKTLPPEVVICDEISMRLLVANTGSGAMRGVRITDTLPDGLIMTDNRNAFTIDVGDLAAGQTREYAVAMRASRTGEFTNTAQAQEEGGLKADASARIRVRQPVLVITKRGPNLRYIGRAAVFDITVQNTGDAPARDAILTDLVPPSTEVVATDGGQLAAGKVMWNLGTLAPQAARTVRLTLKPNDIGIVQNTATVEAFCAKATASATLEVRGIPAILLEVVDEPDPIEIGSNVTYSIAVTNQGSAMGTNIVVNCTLPPELQYVSSTGPVQGLVEGQNVRFAPLPTLAPKATVTYKVVATGIKEADARFKVVMTSDQTTSPVEETESTHIY